MSSVSGPGCGWSRWTGVVRRVGVFIPSVVVLAGSGLVLCIYRGLLFCLAGGVGFGMGSNQGCIIVCLMSFGPGTAQAFRRSVSVGSWSLGEIHCANSAILLDWQQLQARIGIDHDRHGHQLKALNAG
jgi:hypothetical protein